MIVVKETEFDSVRNYPKKKIVHCLKCFKNMFAVYEDSQKYLIILQKILIQWRI